MITNSSKDGSQNSLAKILNTILGPSHVLFTVNYAWIRLNKVMNCIAD